MSRRGQAAIPQCTAAPFYLTQHSAHLPFSSSSPLGSLFIFTRSLFLTHILLYTTLPAFSPITPSLSISSCFPPFPPAGYEAARVFLRNKQVPDVWKMDMSQILDSSSSDDEDDEEKESSEDEEDEEMKKKKRRIKEEVSL